MKYLNIKRYKFSTISRTLGNLMDGILHFVKLLNITKINNYFTKIKYIFKRTARYLDLRKFNISAILKKIKITGNKYLFYHLPAFVIFFGLLYLIIPTFYTYDRASIKKEICKNFNVKCSIKGKLNYVFFPTPRLIVKDIEINIPAENKINFITAKKVLLKLSIKNLLVKEKHKINKIIITNFESNINLKKLKNYEDIFKKKTHVPIFFSDGKIILNDEKNYVATINDVNLSTKFAKDSSAAKLKGKFLDYNIILNLNNKITDNKPITDIELKIKDLVFYSKLIFSNFDKKVKNGKFLIKKDKNKISGFFDYENGQLEIVKSSVKNVFMDGKLTGKIEFLPFFDFDLDLNLNSINFTRLFNYFLFLDNNEQKKLFKINNKINGKLSFSSEKVYSKHNLVRSFESRLKFYNGNTKIEQLLINLGKLGAADLLGNINNDKKTTNLKFETNIFVDNKKKFLSKFGIYNKEKISSNLFVQGNFDLENVRISLYEISHEEKLSPEDVNFIESEFNDLMLENGFENLFNFRKFKVFLKSTRDENN